MRVIIQRVSKANVSIENVLRSSIDKGYVVLFGFEEEESPEDFAFIIKKLLNLRLFNDSEGKMNWSIQDVKGDLLMISQFTLFAQTKKGNRPSFIKSASYDQALTYQEEFFKMLSMEYDFQTGEFGADMKVELINDGPVTISLDSKNKE